MSTPINPIPDGRHTLSPYLVVQGAANALDYYKIAFGARETCRLDGPGGTIVHAEFKIGDSVFMLADENPRCSDKSPEALGGSPVKLHLYVNDVDSTFADAIKAGGRETMAPTNQFWGDRMGALIDPFGHHWLIASRVEDVDPSEWQSRMEAFFAAQPA